ncbi:T9SS type A sorting domain-containing protein [Dyadobacter sp. LHD-138]|uniref:T9SS type A sorting domain-containing protein n=1 Tax=Dyadobacter sp. LHD-138 TaxID=3071413 RepID=UPI0038D3E8F0
MEKVKTVTIHNLAGIDVYNVLPPADGIFAVETLPQGVYVLSIIYWDNTVHKKKFVR